MEHRVRAKNEDDVQLFNLIDWEKHRIRTEVMRSVTLGVEDDEFNLVPVQLRVEIPSKELELWR